MARKWLVCIDPAVILFREHYEAFVRLLCGNSTHAHAWLPAEDERVFEVDLRDSWPFDGLRQPFWAICGEPLSTPALESTMAPIWGSVTTGNPLDYRKLDRFVQHMASSFEWAVFPFRIDEYDDFLFVTLSDADVAAEFANAFIRTDRHIAREPRNLIAAIHELTGPLSTVADLVIFHEPECALSWASMAAMGTGTDIFAVLPPYEWLEDHCSIYPFDAPRPWPEWFWRECTLIEQVTQQANGPAMLELETEQIDLAVYAPTSARAFDEIRRNLPSGSGFYFLAADGSTGSPELCRDIYRDLLATNLILPKDAGKLDWLYWQHADGWGTQYEALRCRDKQLVADLLGRSISAEHELALCAML